MIGLMFGLLFGSPSDSLMVVRQNSKAPFGTYDVSAVLNAVKLETTGIEVTVSGNAETGWRLEPKSCGELTLRLTKKDGRIEASTILTLPKIDSKWGVVTSVPGPFVNTPAWEDGVSLSPDSQSLFVHYSPITISGMFQPDPANAWVAQARGPFSGPQRPDFPRKRIDDQGRVRSGFGLYGMDKIDRPFPPTALYSFRRLADGTFGDPRLIGPQDDGDGSLGAFGPMIPTGEGAAPGWMVLTFNDPRTNGPGDSESDVVLLPFQPNKPAPVGLFARENGQVVCGNWAPIRLGPDSLGHQGNSHLHIDRNHAASLWVDDETKPEKDLWVADGTGQLPNLKWTGTWLHLPPRLSGPESEEIQPFFNGQFLVMRKDNGIKAFPYKGGPFTEDSSWGTMETWLQTSDIPAKGQVFVLGEPTVGHDRDGEILSFVYGVMRDDGTIDLNAGYVRARTARSRS